MIDLPRSSGVQLHLTSLPGGRLGPEAYRFVDWLAAAGQTWWQVLPLGPPDRYGSPYKARSAFAAWPGFLGDRRAAVSSVEVSSFRDRHGFWAADWERFSSRGALADQVRFEREWSALRAYGAERGVRLFGDVAIYVAPDSADHRAHPELFRPGFVAGAPPDAFSDDGQLWGNPVYDWPALRRRRYRWWVERLRRTLSLFDLARIDHFRGFVAYWAVPAGARTARGGSWKRGPGGAVFDTASRSLGSLPLVAEDLGVITPAVTALRESLGFPGMVVLQFGFDPGVVGVRTCSRTTSRTGSCTRARTITTRPGVVLVAVLGWAVVCGLGVLAVRRRRVSALVESDPVGAAIAGAGRDAPGPGCARARVEARMNDPGRAGGSWRWRMAAGALTPALARRLREATEEEGRLAVAPGGAAALARGASGS